MKFERSIDPEARIAILKVEGDLGDRELLELADALESDPEIRPELSLLIDLRQADGREVTSAGVRALAAQPLVLSPTSRRAVVVPSALGFGMARMYEMRSEARGGVVRVFRDYDEARRWVELGV